ncbi:MAG: dinitrogenase iron-molybdenum cofactor [Candidatus Lokiarchaeota archaeon]|nr:dinitrogenase iron-molybdenum cofactor [Candidatus Lokiarchaeota archaeon]
MIISISTDNGMVSAHFGRCPQFTLVKIDEEEKKYETKVIPNPGHQMGLIPKFLNEQGVDVVIAGGMGRRAIGFFNQYGIETIVGVTGSIDEVIQKILDGTLEGGKSLCSPGGGKGYGLDRTDKDHTHHKHE